MDERISSRAVGTNYEILARNYLERVGLVFVAANVTLRCGEIDLIMRDHQTWVFVEVRFRRRATFGDAATSVTYAKRKRLLQTAAVWLARYGASFDTSSCRFDVFAITGHRTEWLPDAFGMH